MNKKPMYLGLSGLAGTGKDTFYKYLKTTLNKNLFKVKRYSLGDCLKEDAKEWCVKKYSIDPTNCTREEKNFIRPFLVSHASIMRAKSNGRYWIDLLQKKIDSEENQDIDLAVITDIRYHEYDNDEVFWVKEELGGILVHLTRYYTEYNVSGIPSTKYLQPINEDERRNDPSVKIVSDLKLEIYDVGTEEKDIEEEVLEKVNEFIGWYENNQEENGWKSLTQA